MIGEHDAEPAPGLPAPLPGGERMLWQGAPAWWPLAKSAFHVRGVAFYFALLVAWRVASAYADGAGAAGVFQAASIPLGLGAAAVALLSLMAWLMARTTLYTLTSQRVIFRIGAALPMTVNLPFKVVDAASLKVGSSGTGDIALEIGANQRVSYLLMWPHVRPWHFARPQATLRAVPRAEAVAARVSAALAEFTGQEQQMMAPAPAPACRPSADGRQPKPARARDAGTPPLAAAS